MPPSNVDLLREGYAAFSRGDFETALTYWDPDVEIDASMNFGAPESYRGLEGVRRFYDAIFRVFEKFTIEPEEIIELDDAHLVVVTRTVGTHRLSGVTVEAREANLWTVRGRRAVKVVRYADKEEALRDAGAEPASA